MWKRSYSTIHYTVRNLHILHQRPVTSTVNLLLSLKLLQQCCGMRCIYACDFLYEYCCCPYVTIAAVVPSVRSYKRFLPQNRGLRRRWEGAAECGAAHSTCHTGTSYILTMSSYTLFCSSSIDAKPPVFRYVYEYISTEPLLNRAVAQTPWQN